MTELWRLGARDLAAKIAAREVSSAQVVEAHLDRIALVNSKVNAVVRVLSDDARAAARKADEAVASGLPLGPLHGVPFTVKENIDVGGLPTTLGVPSLAQAIAPLDAPVVQRMRDAGGVLIARTNLPDMALRSDTASTLYGHTSNPWNSARTAGGSSGGEAVALATGMTPIGLGNDIGGSLRNPANACGIASIKPSAGRVPDAGFIPSEDRLLAVQLFNAQGPMARRVADVRLGLEILIGAHPRDPWSIDAPLLGRPLGGRIRVAVASSPLGDEVDTPIVDAVQRAAAALSDAGYDVVEATPPRYAEAEEVWARILMGDFAPGLDDLIPLMGPEGAAFLGGLYRSIQPVTSVAEMSQLFVQRDSIARAWSAFMVDHPLVLTPTWTRLPFKVGFDTASDESVRATRTLIRPQMPANLLGLPSACVPAGFDSESGLPIGVLITGRRFREDICLDAAEAIEARLPLVTPIDPKF